MKIIYITFILVFSFYSNARVSKTRSDTQLYYGPKDSQEYKMKRKVSKGTTFQVLKDRIKSDGKTWQLVKVIDSKRTPIIGFRLIYQPEIAKARKNRCGMVLNKCGASLNTIIRKMNEIKAKESRSQRDIIKDILDDCPNTENDLQYHKGCEVLKELNPKDFSTNKTKLTTCLKNLIQVGKNGAEVTGAKYVGRNASGKIYKSTQAISSKLFFKNIFNKLNIKERNFLGRILTSIGEAGNITNYQRLYDKEKKPHLQEMMAVNMVLENRLAHVKRINTKRKKLKQQAKAIYPKLNDAKLIKQLEKDLKGIRKTAKYAKQEKSYVKKIAKQFSDMIKGIKLYKPEYENLSSLDIALDKNGIAFSMFRGIKQDIRRYETKNAPSWYKVISKASQGYHFDNAIKAYLHFNNTMKEDNYPKGVTHYYSTSVKKPEFAKVTTSPRRNPKLEHISFKIDGKDRYTTTHKHFTRRKGSNIPYSCNQTLTEEEREYKYKTGHCFYSNVRWRYHGHKFERK